MKKFLEAKEMWYLNDIAELIKTEFSIEYSEKQLRRIL